MNIKAATQSNIKKAADIIRHGGIVIYPTETVYGIGCDPHNQKATEKINQIKGRTGKPLPLICSNLQTAQDHAELNSQALKLAEHFWPGPLMLILPAKGIYPNAVTQGQTTIGLRVPDSQISRQLAEHSGGCIVSTSANKSGQPPATTAQEASKQLGVMVDMILDGGPTLGDRASTILDITGHKPRILRKGPVSLEDINKILG